MRWAAALEGSSFLLLLCVGVPLKHLGGLGAATVVLGSVHGLVFVYYVSMLVQTVSSGSWHPREIVRMLLFAFIPLGAFANERTLARREQSLRATLVRKRASAR